MSGGDDDGRGLTIGVCRPLRAPLRGVGLALCLLVLSAAEAHAHPAELSSATLTVAPDGTLTLRVSVDVIAFALNERSRDVSDRALSDFALGSAQERARLLGLAPERFLRLTSISAGPPASTDHASAPGGDANLAQFGIPLTIIDSPSAAAIEAVIAPSAAEYPLDAATRAGRLSAADLARLAIKRDFAARGQLPAGVRALRVTLPNLIAEAILTIERPGREADAMPVRGGEPSPLIELDGPSDSFAAQTLRFIGAGFTHVIPAGVDHILFILCLFFASARWRALLAQSLVFTLAHSLTLALATLGVLRLPAALIEPLIALSITVLALENIRLQRVTAWRYGAIFLLGLVHGCGFASALAETDRNGISTTAVLLGFNVGVEVAQTAILVGALLVLGWWRDRPWYRARVAIPVALVLAAAGAWLFFTRL
ncbi:hypothetical protein BH11PLA1_BH11PLA1_09520 [soil metagenome]